MFTVEARDELRDRVLEMARADERVVAAAEVGSLAAGEGDRWSDIDLTFAVEDGTDVSDVLDDWAAAVAESGGVELFDLVAGPSTYRVFMFPDCLQLDVSITPAAEFRPTSPRFRLVFGDAGEMRQPEKSDAEATLGWAVMWARFARVCIERGNYRHAEFSITNLRHHALDFACARRGLPTGYGRGLEQLPEDVHERFAESLVSSIEPDALKEALKKCVAALLEEMSEDDYRRVLTDTIVEL